MRYFLVITFILLAAVDVSAREIVFKNGDKITATVLSEDETSITVESLLFGELTFSKDLIQPEEPPAPKVVQAAEEDEESDWKKKVSVGYSQTGGNTEKSAFSTNISVEKVTGDKEYSGKYSANIASSDGTQDKRKFKANVRYANKFGDSKQWYNYYKVDGDQDRYSNVNYRVVPSVGYGYWFHNTDDYKLKAEAAVGWEHTNYVDGSDSDNELVIIPQGYLEKKLNDDLTFSQELTLYPSLTETSKVRFTSETNLTGALTDKTSWKLSFIDDYNSEPKGAAKKNDYQLISSVEYNF